MGHPRTAYEISQSQVMTPEPIVSLFWRLARQYRPLMSSVLDMGAGDCRFAKGGSYEKYVGVEIDRERVAAAKPPTNGTIIHGCVFKHAGTGYDACIGNPPYARHHDIEAAWKERTVSQLEAQLNVSLNRHCNLYIYFFCLALLKSNPDGLVALVIPYEWVSRPSAKPLREYIQRQRWNVAVYRFQQPIFEGVMTTASVSIVDKANDHGKWTYFDITDAGKTLRRKNASNSQHGVLDYENRGKIWGLRGLSPGSQKIFTLTEGERVRTGLRKRDVVPCVTTLRHVPRTVKSLSKAAFQKHFIEAGAKCWLIRSYRRNRSQELDAYLESISAKARQNYTCQHQKPWFNFLPHPVPQMLFSSGFTEFGPKVLINGVQARAIGSVWGVHATKTLPVRKLQSFLLKINFEKQVVAHAEKLKKVEVKQLNSVLNAFVKRDHRNGRKSTR